MTEFLRRSVCQVVSGLEPSLVSYLVSRSRSFVEIRILLHFFSCKSKSGRSFFSGEFDSFGEVVSQFMRGGMNGFNTHSGVDAGV